MKINKAKKAALAVTITPENFDGGLMYLGEHVPTAGIRKESVGLEVPAKLHGAFMIVTGDKPGMALHPVKWDGKDRYMRIARTGKTVYGSLKALAKAGEHLKVEIVDLDEIKARAKKIGKAIEATRQSDDAKFKVVLLSPETQHWYAGVTVHDGKVEVLNMEQVGKNDKSLQFADLKELPFKALYKELLAA